ncbi:MAG: hypothetical protein ACXACP_13415 [Candidatus Hodarchaeales archaeon]
MELNQRRLYLNNWAIMTSAEKIMWSFGDIDQDKQEMTLDFISALSKLGQEVWGKEQAIGMVRLRYPTPHPSSAREIMIINLLKKYNIVISDPLVTTRLMSKLNFEEKQIQQYDDIRSILAGSISVIYSQLYSKDSFFDTTTVDELFQEAVTAVTFNPQVTVGDGVCSNFSSLTVEELLFFHAILKRLFESYAYSSNIYQSRPWGVIHSSTGAIVYLEYEPPIDGALISAFSAVTAVYCNLLFSAYPSRLIFGYDASSSMEFISTPNNIFIINNPSRLLRLQRFVRQWKKVPAEIKSDIIPSMKSYFAELTVLEERQRLKALEFHQIINRLTRMGIRRAREYRED